MRPLAKRIMVIDDLADRPHDCDLLTQLLIGDVRQAVPHACGLACLVLDPGEEPDERRIHGAEWAMRAGSATL